MSDFSEELVASLTKVRDQTEEKLKSVPAYSGYLEVVGLTDKITDTLGAGNDAAGKILTSLKAVTENYKEYLATVSEYRQWQTLDKYIGELAAIGTPEKTAPEPVPQADSEPKHDIATRVEQALAGGELETGDQSAVASGSAAEGAPTETAAPAAIVASNEPAAASEHMAVAPAALETSLEAAPATTPIAVNEMSMAQPEAAPAVSTAAPEPAAAPAVAVTEMPTPALPNVATAVAVSDDGQGHVAATPAAADHQTASAPIAASEATAIVAEAPAAPAIAEASPTPSEGAERAA